MRDRRCALARTSTLEISVNERAQYVTVNGKTAIAGITDKQIAFRVELSANAPLDFVVDRLSGLINISTLNVSRTRVRYTGQCRAADAASLIAR